MAAAKTTTTYARQTWCTSEAPCASETACTGERPCVNHMSCPYERKQLPGATGRQVQDKGKGGLPGDISGPKVPGVCGQEMHFGGPRHEMLNSGHQEMHQGSTDLRAAQGQGLNPAGTGIYEDTRGNMYQGTHHGNHESFSETNQINLEAHNVPLFSNPKRDDIKWRETHGVLGTSGDVANMDADRRRERDDGTAERHKTKGTHTSHASTTAANTAPATNMTNANTTAPNTAYATDTATYTTTNPAPNMMYATTTNTTYTDSHPRERDLDHERVGAFEGHATRNDAVYDGREIRQEAIATAEARKLEKEQKERDHEREKQEKARHDEEKQIRHNEEKQVHHDTAAATKTEHHEQREHKSDTASHHHVGFDDRQQQKGGAMREETTTTTTYTKATTTR